MMSNMNNNELLAEFCRLAPKEWGCRIFTADLPNCEVMDGDLGFMPEKSALLVRLSDDRASAEALIYLLDWLECELEDGRLWQDWGEPGPDRYKFQAESGTWNGKTRIEAVLRACVAVLQEREGKE